MKDEEILEELIHAQWRLYHASDRLILIKEALEEIGIMDVVLNNLFWAKRLTEEAYDVVSNIIKNKDFNIEDIEKALERVEIALERLDKAGKILDELEERGKKNWDETTDYNFDDATNFLFDAMLTLNKVLERVEESNW